MKCLLKLLAIGVMLVVLLVVAVALLINPVVESAIEGAVGFTTELDTELESADIGILSGDLGFDGLHIANPPGFEEGPLLSLGTFRTTYDLQSLTSDVIQIEEVVLDGLELNLELKGTKSNIQPLLERLRELSRSTGGTDEGGTPPTEPDSEPSAEGPEVHIGRVKVAGVKAGLRITGIPAIDGVYSINVPPIVIENLGDGEQEGTVSEWTARILEVVMTSAQSAGQGTFPAEWQTLLSGDLDGIGDALKSEAKEQLEGLLDEELEKLPENLTKPLDELKKKNDLLDGILGGKD